IDKFNNTNTLLSNNFNINIDKKNYIEDDIFEKIEVITQKELKKGEYVRVAIKLKSKTDINNKKINVRVKNEEFKLKNIQWEKGTVLTDYRPSVAEVTKKSANLKITTEEITSKVEKIEGEYVTSAEISHLNDSWTATFKEGYEEGIVKMDKDGIEVTSTGVKSKTSMSAEGFKITNTNDNIDVFSVKNDGMLDMVGSIATKSNGARSVFTGDGLNFFNDEKLVGKVSYDTTGESPDAKNRLWLRSLQDYALKLQSGGDLSIQAGEESNKTIYLQSEKTIINSNLRIDKDLETNGILYGQNKIQLRSNEIYVGTIPSNLKCDYLRLDNNLIASDSSQRIHFLKSDGSGASVFAENIKVKTFGNGGSTLMHDSLDGNGKNLGYSASRFNQVSAISGWFDNKYALAYDLPVSPNLKISNKINVLEDIHIEDTVNVKSVRMDDKQDRLVINVNQLKENENAHLFVSEDEGGNTYVNESSLLALALQEIKNLKEELRELKSIINNG
ncbi:MAG: hypothetical protein ACRCX2_22060, partial [Paraclostridium sp.]